MTEVITRAQFEAFVAHMGETISQAALNSTNSDASSALHDVAHEFQSFDIDWLFNPEADHNQPKPAPKPEPSMEDIAKAIMTKDGKATKFDAWENVVRQIFRNEWAHALPLRKIVRLSAAMLDSDADHIDVEEKVKKVLRGMVRRGTLRSRQISGVRHWEIDFDFNEGIEV